MAVEHPRESTKGRSGQVRRRLARVFALMLVFLGTVVLVYQDTSWVAIGLMILSGLVIGFLIVVVRLKRNHWASPDPVIREVESDGSMTDLLARLGFDPRGTYAIEKANSSADFRIALFQNGDGSMIARRVLIASKQRPIGPILVFSTKFADGVEVVTSNSPLLSPTPVPKSRQSFSFPGVDDPARLLALHRKAVAETGEFSTPVDVLEPDPATFLATAIHDELAHLVEINSMRLDRASNRYRLTWTGACLITLGLLWPFGAIRRTARRVRAARLIRDWEQSLA